MRAQLSASVRAESTARAQSSETVEARDNARAECFGAVDILLQFCRWLLGGRLALVTIFDTTVMVIHVGGEEYPFPAHVPRLSLMNHPSRL